MSTPVLALHRSHYVPHEAREYVRKRVTLTERLLIKPVPTFAVGRSSKVTIWSGSRIAWHTLTSGTVLGVYVGERK